MSTTDAFCYPVSLTQAQRRLIAGLIPDLAGRLKIEEATSRTIRLTSTELQQIIAACETAILKATKRKVRDGLQHVVEAGADALERYREGAVGRIPVAQRLYQFQVTLQGIEPPIWRRIQVKDCTLDKLHEHIQTAMGWTNSHLHSFHINDQPFGDPLLLEEYFDEMNYEDSTTARLSEILPKSGERFRFDYEYDFGDCWQHNVLFEGCLHAEKGTRYPVCVEGQRTCPPEDVGGTPGYYEYLEALVDPEHERHDELLRWRGEFDPEVFDAEAVTNRMRRGLPDWREYEEI